MLLFYLNIIFLKIDKNINIIISLRIGFSSFNLSNLDKGCCRFERFRLALFKNRRWNKMRE